MLAGHMERVNTLPKPLQKFILRVLESVLAQQGH